MKYHRFAIDSYHSVGLTQTIHCGKDPVNREDSNTSRCKVQGTPEGCRRVIQLSVSFPSETVKVSELTLCVQVAWERNYFPETTSGECCSVQHEHSPK